MVRPVLPWLLLAAMVVGCLRTFNLTDAIGHLRAAHLGPMGLAAAASLASLLCRSTAWSVLVAPQHHISWLQMARYTVAATAASCVLPARGGELVRLRLLQCRHEVAVPSVISYALTEKLLGAVSLFALAAPLPWLLPGLPAWLQAWAIGGLLVGSALLAGLGLWARRRRGRGQQSRWLQGLSQPPARLGMALGFAAAAWPAEVWVVQAGLRALDTTVAWPAALVVVVVVNLAIAAPSTPGHLGVMEGAVVAGLHLFDVPTPVAVGFAMIYRWVQLLPVMCLALLDARLLLSLRRKPQPSSGG